MPTPTDRPLPAAKFPAGAALVIGGSGGLGAEIARTLAREGSDVAVTYHSRRARADEVVADVAAHGRKGGAYALDLVDGKAIKAAVDQVAVDFGALHTVVFASGPAFALRYFSQLDPATMLHHLNADVMGFFNVAQAALPYLRQTRGSFVACATCGLDKWPLKDAMSVVPKAGVWAIARGIAREEGRFGVRANVVGTGVINAGVTVDGLQKGDVPESFLTGTIEATPLRRMGEAEDIAEAVCYFASAQAKFVTGQVLNVDGGWSV